METVLSSKDLGLDAAPQETVPYENVPKLTKEVLSRSLHVSRVEEDLGRKYINDVLADPGWLDEFAKSQGLADWRDKIDIDEDEFSNMFEGGWGFMPTAISIRIAEKICDEKGVEYVWRGGTYGDIASGKGAAFNFNLPEAMGYINQSHENFVQGTIREKPCLMRIKLATIIDEFKKDPRELMLQEHGAAAFMSSSFDLNMTRVIPEVFRVEAYTSTEFTDLMQEAKNLVV